MEILREQFTGFIIFSFSFTLSTFISNIEARIFLDTSLIKKRAHQIRMIILRTFLRTSEAKFPKYLRTFSLGPKIRRSYKKKVHVRVSDLIDTNSICYFVHGLKSFMKVCMVFYN